MPSYVKKMLKPVIHVQVLVVILVFALMVFFSYNFMSGIERRHLSNNVDNVMYNVQTFIETDFREPETTLGVISEDIKNMILQSASSRAVHDYLVQISSYLTADERLMSHVTAVYGYFDIFNGLFMTGTDWVPPAGYMPYARPWFSAAIEAGGKVGVTEPYLNASNGRSIVTFARCIFDNDGRRLGIICLDLELDRLFDYVVTTYVTGDSYGILLDKLFYVLAHPEPAYIGEHIDDLYIDTAIESELWRNKNISELKTLDHKGNESVLFASALKNGWYMVIIVNAKSYYQSVTRILFILVLLGLFFSAFLSAILLSIIYAKKKAERRTRIMLDATPLCASFWDQDNNVIDCNMEAVKLFGATNKKEYLERFFDFSPEYQPDGKLSSAKMLDYINKAFVDGYCNFEWTHRKLSGELIPCENMLVRVVDDKEIIVCGYTRDLREKKNMIAKMHEADEYAKILFDATPLSSFMVDSKLNIVECNQEIVRLFGLSDKKEYIDNVFSFFPEYQPSGQLSRDLVARYIDEAFEEGDCRFELTHIKPDGECIPTEVTLVRVKFRGGHAVAGYIRDLRELKTMIAEMHRAEIAEESSKAKSDFLAKMSHEIRTPMNAIIGIAEIQLRDETLPLLTKEALERIYTSGDLLLGIVNDILDLSKIESGKLELFFSQYDIASLIHDTVKLNIMRFENKPIDFKLVVSEDVPSKLIGDELRIKQILNNLLSNAFKYTEQGRIELKLSSEHQGDGANVTLVFRVSDTGQGMTKEEVQKLGDRFSRFNLEANRKTEGAGLGMNITQNLIQLMNGSLTVESTPGMGSVFTVRLLQENVYSDPIGRELAENLMNLNLKSTAKIRNAQIIQEFMPYGRVLVVDDVETNLYVARGLLAPYGLSIDTVLSGSDAINKIKDGASYDIVFMDHMMPGMDGIEATKHIRNFGYSFPIVALTANALAGQAEMFMKNGFDAFISKPIDIRQLNSLLNKLIRDKQPPAVIEEARKQRNTLYAAGGHNIAVEPQLAEFFLRDAKKAMSILNALIENKFRRGDDLGAFIINVHAMKSALANIGESELSNKASELEQAGREQKRDLILSSLPLFLELLQKVIEKLEPSEEDLSDGDDRTKENDNREYLLEKLKNIQTACNFYDKKAAKEALSDLKSKSWPRTTRDSLSEIAKHLLHSEFDKAAKIAEDIGQGDS